VVGVAGGVTGGVAGGVAMVAVATFLNFNAPHLGDKAFLSLEFLHGAKKSLQFKAHFQGFYIFCNGTEREFRNLKLFSCAFCHG
jgi:hypothetical protein